MLTGFVNNSLAKDEIIFPKFYKYYKGNIEDSQWINLNYDDSNWIDVDISTFPLEDWNGDGLFRFKIENKAIDQNKFWGLVFRYSGYAELYLDGKLIIRNKENEGRKFFNIFPEIIPVNFSKVDTLNESKHLISIKYSADIGEGTWEGFQPGFYFEFVDLKSTNFLRNNFVKKIKTHQMLISGISIAFFIIHFSLFLFYRQPTANLFFSLISLGFALNVFFDIQNFFSLPEAEYLFNIRLNYFGVCIALISILFLAYSLFYKKVPKYGFIFAGLGISVFLFSFFNPLSSEGLGQIITLIFFLEILRIVILAIMKKLNPVLKANWIIVSGISVTILLFIFGLISTSDVISLHLYQSTFPIERYGFLFFLISISVFLAYNFAGLNKELNEKRKDLVKEIDLKNDTLISLEKALNEVETLKEKLNQENVYLRDEIKLDHNFSEIITNSQKMKEMLSQLESIAPTESTVLITGESGTGKELIARAIHNLSKRAERPLVKVNCAALPTNLIESELFGHVKGAFTGAIKDKLGRFGLADKGTIFLDEIGELPIDLQAKLLRVLQENEIEKIGSTKTEKIDVRVITATNRNLEEEIKKGNFREDLFYRLNVIPLQIPPLRERKDDIELLTNHFVRKYATRNGREINNIPAKSLNILKKYYWPGNVRELENVIERAVILSTGNKLELSKFFDNDELVDDNSITSLEEIEKNHILKILKQTNWKLSGENGASELLCLKRTTLIARMKKLGIEKPS